MKIKKNDLVKIMTGKDRGKSGKILNVFLKERKVVVEGINLAKKHKKPKRSNEKGQTVEIARPMDVSKIRLICPRCGQPARVGYKMAENGNKFRICKKCEQEI